MEVEPLKSSGSTGRSAQDARPLTGILEVAALAGVSAATVSNVLNEPNLVAPATRKRVEIVIDHVGYIPNRNAAALRSGRSRMLGLVVPDIANPFFAELARGAVDAAGERGYVVALCNSDGKSANEHRSLDVLQEQRVAGVLVTPVGQPPKELATLRDRSSHVVLLDVPARQSEFCSVCVDDVRGGALAIDHLIDLGARSVALVNGPRALRQCADRRRGVLGAIKRHSDLGVVVVEYEVAAMSITAGAKVIADVLSEQPSVDAVFCTNDLLAIGAERALAAAGVRVPDDVLVVGYDDIELAGEAAVPLTSIRQPTYELGRAGTELLLREIADGRDHQHEKRVFSAELVVRSSSSPAGVSPA